VSIFGALIIALVWGFGGRPPAFDLYTHDALQNLHDPWSIRLAALALLPGDTVAYASFAGVLLVTMMISNAGTSFVICSSCWRSARGDGCTDLHPGAAGDA